MPRYYPGRFGPGPGFGRGRGFGFGGGYGRGWCWWPQRPWCRGWGGWGPPTWMYDPYAPEPYWGPYGGEPPFMSPEEEMAALKDEEAFLRQELEDIQKRLAELQPGGSGS